MSQNIVQTLGIDASQALATLAQLDKAYATTEEKVRAFADAHSGLNSTSKKMEAAVKAINKNVPASTAQIGRLTTSLELLSRIAFTQFIVRGMSQIRNAIQSTAESAVEFQKQIALTTTIADGAQFGQIADQVKRLSNEFNLPLHETAEGLYNALSNQVGNFGESVTFSEEAARFAKATNSSLADSVDLLSGALASYGLTVDDTAKVSSIFFTAIDKGRLTADELGNAVGRLLPISSELGVSLEEVGGALASVSVKGSKTSETITQVRSILSALQKPSVAMRKALEELGFTSSEVGVKTLGLSGLLDALAKSTGGSAEQMAKLFPNIRGLAGATSLTSDNVKSLSANIKEMTEAGRDFNREKFIQATATDAERATKEINELRNELTTGLGQAALKTAADLFQLVGGASNLISVGKVAAPTLLAVAAGMAAVKAQTTLATAGLGGFSKALGALALGGVAIGVGQSIGNFLEEKRMTDLFRGLQSFEAAQKQAMDAFLDTQNQERDAFNETNAAKVQTINRTNQALMRAYQKDVANLKSAEKQKTDLLFSAEQARGGALFSAKKARGGVGFDGNAIRAAKAEAESLAKGQAAAFEKFKAGTALNEGALESVLGRKLTDPDDVVRGLAEARAKASELQTQINKALAGEKGLSDLRSGLFLTFKELAFAADGRNSVPGQFGEGLRTQFAELDKELRSLSDKSKITEQDFQKVIDLRNKLGGAALQDGNPIEDTLGRLGFADTINLLDSALLKLQDMKRIQEETGQGSASGLKAQLQAIQPILDAALPSFQSLTTSINSQAVTLQTQLTPSAENMKLAFQATDLATLNVNTGLLQAKTQAELIAGSAAATASAYQSAAAAAAQITANAGSEVNKAFGGPAYHADGGSPRGTDTIPAMLSPGEYVINAQSSRKFFSQIQAINAGKQPLFRQDGGTVNNTSVGDIYVSGGKSPEKTARAVMREIRREQRRGTGK